MSQSAAETNRFALRDLAFIGLFSVLIAVCSWITIPGPVPFTLQTFGIFCALGMLGGKRGTCSILVYILLGIIGIPVFSGFTGGVGQLLGMTGGYIVGFLLMGLLYWLVTRLAGQPAGDDPCHASGTCGMLRLRHRLVRAGLHPAKGSHYRHGRAGKLCISLPDSGRHQAGAGTGADKAPCKAVPSVMQSSL